MANPYHDDTGKFCSKGEMQSALKRLASAGDTQGYFKLQAEYEAIETEKRLKDVSDASAMLAIAMRDNRTSSLELIERVNQTENSEIIRAVAEADTSNWNIYLTDAVLKNPNTPDDVKEQIVSEISESSAAGILEARTTSSEAKLAIFNAFKENPNVVARLLADGKTLDPDAAYEYANQHPSTLSYYVKGYGIRSPEVEEALRDKINYLVEQKGATAYATSSLAQYVGAVANEESTISACIKYSKYGAHKFIQNPSFTQKNATELLYAASEYEFDDTKKLLSSDVNKTKFDQLLKDLDETPLAPLERKSPSPIRVAYVKDELKKHGRKGDERGASNNSSMAIYVRNLQAGIDAYEDTYSKLVKEHAAASNRKNAEKIKTLQARIDNVHSYRKANGERKRLADLLGLPVQ